MTRTKKRVAAVACAMLFLLMPVSYYCFFAFVRHEHFYHGLPTSYWERTGEKCYDGLPASYWKLAFDEWNPRVSVDKGKNPGFPPPILLSLILDEDKDTSVKAAAMLAGTRTY